MHRRLPLVALVVLASPLTRAGDDLAKYDSKITADDRAHWAFQPVKRPQIPSPKGEAWCRNPIDRFILAKLEEKSWTPTPQPAALSLLRRIHFDLTGLPPSIQEQEQFLRDPSQEAMDRVVDNLLARPQYGERWSRHWLDLVRFAESNGFERDAAKPSAWRYRDWVIRAFNEDKPYDRFLIEQIAGDELPDADASTLIATGFHRAGPWDDEPSDPAQDRFDQLDDMVATTSEVFLGLTLACARCHNHKFEPLTALDYTRMVAIFSPLKRPTDGRTELDAPAGSKSQIEAIAARDRKIASLQRWTAELRERTEIEILNDELSALSPEVRIAFRTPIKTELQKKLVAESRGKLDEQITLALADEESRALIGWVEGEVKRLRVQTPDLPRGYFWIEPTSAPAPTRLLGRGQATNPGPIVAPGLPAVLVTAQPSFLPPDGHSSRRRLTLARWLARPDHPLTARVIVNRVWQHHFGEGLVRSVSDFGVAGDEPTHPELLDWLADWFVNEGGWSIKKLNRLILTSNTSRMGKLSRPEYEAEDPDNDFLWRIPYRRLEVEAIRDAILSASGRLNPEMYGPSMFPAVPKGALEGNSDPETIWKASGEHDASRRTIYAFVKRTMVVPMIEVLDFCDTIRSAPKRQITNTAPQALALFNGEFVANQSRYFAERAIREAGDDPTKQIDLMFRLALARRPKSEETQKLVTFMEQESGQDSRAGKVAALTRVARVIFNSNEFAFTD